MENFTKLAGSKAEIYQELILQFKAMRDLEQNIIANMANACALIQIQFEWHWVGFYLVDEKANNLVLGPFQGPLACTRIPYGKGVCGTAWAQARSQMVENVHEFPGHIACSSLSLSEIVVPCYENGSIKAVLDIDSASLASFDTEDQKYLEIFCAILYP